MTDKIHKLPDTYLHALADGQLEVQRNELVEKYLAENPDKLLQFEQYLDFNDKLQRAYDPVLQETVPDRLLDLVKQFDDDPVIEIPSLPDDQLNQFNRWVATRQGLAILNRGKSILGNYLCTLRVALTNPLVPLSYGIAGIFLGWLVTLTFIPTTSTSMGTGTVNILSAKQHAINAHRIYSKEKRHAVEVHAEEKKHLMGWLSKRLNEKVGPTDLEKYGFDFIGGRLLPVNDRHAGMYLYQNAKGVHLSVFISTHLDKGLSEEPVCVSRDELSVCSWRKNTLSYYVVSKAAPFLLKRIADVVRARTPAT